MSKKKEVYLSGLLARDPEAIRKIYQDLRPRIQQMVTQQGGTHTEGEDVFQEALIVIWRKAQAEDFELTSSFYSYLYGIATFVWLRKKKKKDNNTVTLENVKGLGDVENIDQQLEINDRRRLFRKHFKRLDAGCQRVLRLFFTGKSMKDIADKLNIENEHAARNRKYRCQKKLERSILKDPLSAELSS